MTQGLMSVNKIINATNDGNKEISENAISRLDDLAASRAIIEKRKNIQDIAAGLKHIAYQESNIISEINPALKKKFPSIRNSTYMQKLPDNFQPELSTGYNGLQKIPEATKNRQGLDSTVFLVWENNAWKRKGKYSYKYNTNEKLTSYAGFGLIEGVFSQTERGSFEFNTAGKLTLDQRESVSEFATNIWIIDRKIIHKYNTSNRLISTEIYGQYYDQSLGYTVNFGIEKTEYSYNTAGEIILYTYYEWDESLKDWARSVKIETNTVNGLETLYASYQWDNTYSSWVGVYKTEKSLLDGTEFINNTIYSWNAANENWYPRLKAEYIKTSNANGVVVTQNNYKLSPGTLNLIVVSRSVFSSPVLSGILHQNSFKYKENSTRDNVTQTWTVDSNTEYTFNESKVLTGWVAKQRILKNSTSAFIWVDKSIMTNTIQNGKIDESKTDNFSYNQLNDINELTGSTLETFTYDQWGLMATKTTKTFDIGTTSWNNSSRYDYSYNSRLVNTGQVIYEWKNADWKLVSRTEYEEDQSGNILKDIYIYFSEEFNQNIISKWIQLDYDANLNLTASIDVKSTIKKNAQTGKNELETKGKKTTNIYSFNALTTIISSVFDASKNTFIDTEKIENEYFPAYPTALKTETVYSFDTTGLIASLKEKTDFTYNFNYPANLLMLPFNTLIKGNPILNYYKYQPVNALKKIWNSNTSVWTDNERTLMFFTTKTLTAVMPLLNPDIMLYANPQNGKLHINKHGTYNAARIILYDLFGREVLNQIFDDNGTIDYNLSIRGIHTYSIIQNYKCISKGKIIL